MLTDGCATWLWPSCAAATTLTGRELSVLRALECPPSSRLACELSAGHDDAHAAFVAAAHGGDRWWWLRWDVRRRELLLREPCDRSDEDTADDCLLPEAHPGRHSFEFEK
ncbi:hypothetical protein [Actinoplanes sp. NPDC049316]|uniref:hypothetical protein n=1 Tax=Actinoplanes sp. NPDC049316 TaxID=3154727 RepID=UPI00342CCCA4